jgi:ADP-heptose:LPS heptosyltransferase
LHLAAWCGVPVVAIHGPTDPARHGPVPGLAPFDVVRMGCPPSASSRGAACYDRRCPRAEDCAREIPVEAVAAAVQNRRP